MSLPSVLLNELDGQLGVLPSGRKALAIAGYATGTGIALNTPVGFSRTTDVLSALVRGPLVHAACYAIKNYGVPVTLVRTGGTTAATQETIDITGVLGSSVVTYGADTTADDDYDLYFKVVNGGTIGTPGITFQYSLTGGRNLSPVTALLSANTFVFPNSGGVGFAFAAGTLLAGDVVRGRTHAPKPSSGEVGAALDALRLTSIQWDIVEPAFDIDGTLFDAIETSFGSGNMKRKMWAGSARCPTNAETEATYKTALDAIFAAKATTRGMLCAGAADITSGADFGAYRRPIVHAVAARLANVTEEIDLADINLGTLPGVSIRDTNGNPYHHDELANPGLDDSRFCVLRTHDDAQGVYVNNPRLLSTTGSDFEFAQHRRIMNLFREVLDRYFLRRLSRPIVVSRKTGKILESEAAAIDAECNALCDAVLMAKPKASDGGINGKFVRVSRNDNLLSTKKLTGQGAIVPLAYPKTIELDIGFRNPALQIVQV